MSRHARSWPSRLGWMVALYAGGVMVLALVALALHLLMHAAGMR